MLRCRSPGRSVRLRQCANSALFRLLEHREDRHRPAWWGVPVGFVGAAESKAALSESGLPAIACARPQRGKQRGGSDCERSALPPGGRRNERSDL
ncbi:hypothetical protein C7K65_04975 [Klebsiella pneumoniae subsp. pneumoniae]|nr:hypothetical protein C7K65_04975 [Klebsiella pneumoniae subsp. pneumoniae]